MWVTILGFLGPLLVQLAQSCGKDPVTAAREAYDPDTDTFSEPVVRSAIVQTHHAIRLAQKDMSRAERKAAGRISKSEIREKAIAKLREGLTATPEQVASCAAQAMALPEIDHEVSEG